MAVYWTGYTIIFFLIAHSTWQRVPVIASTKLNQDHDGFESVGTKSLKALVFLGAGVSSFLGFATLASADEAEHGLACASYPWPHKGILSSYDHAS